MKFERGNLKKMIKQETESGSEKKYLMHFGIIGSPKLSKSRNVSSDKFLFLSMIPFRGMSCYFENISSGVAWF